MTSKRRLRMVDTQGLCDPPSAPTHFTREIFTPAGPPWRQRQAAELDARLGAPVASEGLSYKLARSDPWRLGHRGRFAVVYTRGGPAAARSALPGAGSQSSPGLLDALEDQRFRVLIAVGITLVSLTLFGVALTSAFSRGADVRAHLANLENAVAPLERRAAQLDRLDHQTAALDSVAGRDRSLGRVLADLDWASAHRRSDVAIGALHWLHGVTAVEVASPDSPFVNPDRKVQRATRQLRPGAWLWGVVPSSRGAQ